MYAVPPEMAELAGRFLRPLIERAWSRSAEPMPADIIEDCARPMGDDKRAQLWIIARNNTPIGVVITRNAIAFDGLLVVQIYAGAGHGLLPHFAVLRTRLHQYRKAESAACLQWQGRKGWARLTGSQPVGMIGKDWICRDFG